MKQNVQCLKDGRITIEQDEAVYRFQVFLLGGTHVELLDVQWVDLRSRDLGALTQARATARWWAQQQGWLQHGEPVALSS